MERGKIKIEWDQKTFKILSGSFPWFSSFSQGFILGVWLGGGEGGGGANRIIIRGKILGSCPAWIMQTVTQAVTLSLYHRLTKRETGHHSSSSQFEERVCNYV
jgi:hypothetical protein